MRIKSILEVNNLNQEDGLMDLIIDVDVDGEVALRWELVDPKVWAVYRKQGDLKLDYLELVDSGMNVHGFEFTDSEKKEILGFIEAEVLGQENVKLN